MDWLIYTLITVIAYRYKLKVLAAGRKAYKLQRATAALATRDSAAAADEFADILPPLVDPLEEEAGLSPSGGAAANVAVDAAADAATPPPPLDAATGAKGKGPRTPEAARAALNAAWGGAQAVLETAAAAGPAQLIAACYTLAGYLKTAIAAVAGGAGKENAPPAPLQRGSVPVPKSANPNSLKRVGAPSGAAVRKMKRSVALQGERPQHRPVHCHILLLLTRYHLTTLAAALAAAAPPPCSLP